MDTSFEVDIPSDLYAYFTLSCLSTRTKNFIFLRRKNCLKVAQMRIF
jgi:hypothetical protein